jgi:hypothetical protein
MALVRGLAGVLAGVMLSCGDSIVDGTYSGTPRFLVHGSVGGTSAYVDPEHPVVRIGVFWSVRAKVQGADDILVEQPAAAIRAEYYRPFELKLFDEPGAEHLVVTPAGARYGVAWLAAYQDANGNGRRDEEEPLIGGSSGRVVIRALDALPARDSPTGAALAQGWHIVSLPLDCPRSGPSTQPVADGECGVPLGVSCKSDADCGGGVCVHDFIGPWPTGACLIPEPPPNGCRQRGSVLLKEPSDSTKAYWLKACTVSEDCGRGPPYQCDQQIRGCRPSTDVQVDMNDSGPPRSYCRPPQGAPPPP